VKGTQQCWLSRTSYPPSNPPKCDRNTQNQNTTLQPSRPAALDHGQFLRGWSRLDPRKNRWASEGVGYSLGLLHMAYWLDSPTVGRNRNNSSSIWQAVESNRFVIFSCVAKLNMPPRPPPTIHIYASAALLFQLSELSRTEQIPRSKSGMFQGWAAGFPGSEMNEWMNEHTCGCGCDEAVVVSCCPCLNPHTQALRKNIPLYPWLKTHIYIYSKCQASGQ